MMERNMRAVLIVLSLQFCVLCFGSPYSEEEMERIEKEAFQNTIDLYDSAQDLDVGPEIFARTLDLYEAVSTGDYDKVFIALMSLADPNLLVFDLSALHIASALGHVDMVSILLVLGADPNLRDRKFGMSALHMVHLFSSEIGPERMETIQWMLNVNHAERFEDYDGNMPEYYSKISSQVQEKVEKISNKKEEKTFKIKKLSEKFFSKYKKSKKENKSPKGKKKPRRTFRKESYREIEIPAPPGGFGARNSQSEDLGEQSSSLKREYSEEKNTDKEDDKRSVREEESDQEKRQNSELLEENKRNAMVKSFLKIVIKSNFLLPTFLFSKAKV